MAELIIALTTVSLPQTPELTTFRMSILRGLKDEQNSLEQTFSLPLCIWAAPVAVAVAVAAVSIVVATGMADVGIDPCPGTAGR